MNLNAINSPEFLNDMDIKNLYLLSEEIRLFLLENISKTGGHLSSNLGVVELTVALHKVFNAPEDKILFDVGHQSYTHKILTGRAKDFSSLRKFKGLSGYQKRSESIYDCFEAGHTSTTISAALGMAVARDTRNEKHHIIPVIGDGALTGGIALEALNHLGHIKTPVIVILNDNEMSISKNVGGVNSNLERLRISMPYNKAKQNYKELLNKNYIGRHAYNISKCIKDIIKEKVVYNVFTEMGLDYLGPVDGHDYHDLLRSLNKAKNSNRSIIVHVITKKGKGYDLAENDANGKWHGISSFNHETGESINTSNDNVISWSRVISDAILEKMDKDNRIVTITPAMIGGSQLEKIFDKYPSRSFDVGIAEQHASMFAAGLALDGMHPFLSIYSTFSQRAYDQFNHDISRMNLPIVIGLDRAGLVGEDGETHNGVFDISLFRSLPNFIISAPGSFTEAKSLVEIAFNTTGPFIIRYPRGNTKDTVIDLECKLEIGKFRSIYSNKKRVLLTYGTHSYKFKEIINKDKCGLIHAVFIKPLDEALISELLSNEIEIIIYEPDIKAGGFSSSILEYANEQKLDARLITILSINDIFVEAGSVHEQLNYLGLDYEYILNKHCYI